MLPGDTISLLIRLPLIIFSLLCFSCSDTTNIENKQAENRLLRNVIEYSLIENNLTDSEKAKDEKGKYRIYTEDPTIRELLAKDQETMALIEKSQLCNLTIYEFFIEIKNPEISKDTGRVRIYSTCVYNDNDTCIIGMLCGGDMHLTYIKKDGEWLLEESIGWSD